MSMAMRAVVGSHDVDTDVFGLAAGAGWRLGDVAFGAALGGGHSNFDLDGGLGSGDDGLFNAGIHGRAEFGAAYVLGALAYGYHDVSTSRVVGADTLEANYSAHSFSGRAEAGYRFDTPMVGLAPYLAFQGTSLSIPSYSETASGAGTFALDYDGRTATTARGELGVRLDKTVMLDNAMLMKLTGRAAWAHSSDNDRSIDRRLPGVAGHQLHGVRRLARSRFRAARPRRRACLAERRRRVGLLPEPALAEQPVLCGLRQAERQVVMAEAPALATFLSLTTRCRAHGACDAVTSSEFRNVLPATFRSNWSLHTAFRIAAPSRAALCAGAAEGRLDAMVKPSSLSMTAVGMAVLIGAAGCTRTSDGSLRAAQACHLQPSLNFRRRPRPAVSGAGERAASLSARSRALRPSRAARRAWPRSPRRR